MTVVIDSREHAAAIKAAVNAELGDVECYEYDEVPGVNGNDGTEPRKYAVFSIERRYNPNLNLGAKAGTGGWRAAVRAVGTTVDEARWVMFKTALALNEARLSIGSARTTPIQFESDQAPEYDDGRFAGLALYTYAL